MAVATAEGVAPPRGRPPHNYVWDPEVEYVHLDTGAPFDRDAQKAVLRARKTAIERRRYWDAAKGVRARRLRRYIASNTKRRHPPVMPPGEDSWHVRSDDAEHILRLDINR